MPPTRLCPQRARLRCVLAVLAFTAATLAGHSHATHTFLQLEPCADARDRVKRTVSGVFRVHAECDRLLLEIPPQLFDRDMLVYTELAQVWTTDGDIVPGTVADSRMMRWRRRCFGRRLFGSGDNADDRLPAPGTGASSMQ